MFFISFLFIRVIFCLVFGRKYIKKYPNYTYYVSFFFQIITLPLCYILYYKNIICQNFIYNLTIAYLNSDFFELAYLRDYNLMIHHIITAYLISHANNLYAGVHKYCILHLITLEFGSSFLSIPHIFKKNLLFILRPIIFGLTRIISIFTLYDICSDDNIDAGIRLKIFILNLIIYCLNFKTLSYLIKKKIEIKF